MQPPFLETKLYIPPPRANHLPRPHLVEKLNGGIGRKLTLITAPAGFGKTSLLSQWVSQTDRSIAWLSLETGDDEIARFLSYLIVAVQGTAPQLGSDLLAALQASPNPQINTLLAMLINEIDVVDHEISLILDDYHLVSSNAIHDAMAFIIDHFPRNLHLIISGRADPFLPISRYRARGELVELRMEDLRFSPEETERYFELVGHLGLAEGDIHALDSRTEGWISGIHLAALSMQGHESPSQFIADLAGDNRYIMDYLMEEVLARRPEGTRDFLLKTSILKRMNAGLCDAVTGGSDGKSILSSLERANLFIVSLDNRRLWYRYHHLFAELLRRLLSETFPVHEIMAMHRLASQWYGEHGFVFEAIEHSLAAEDHESALRQIERSAAEIFATAQLVPLTKLWNQFSQEQLQARPKVCLIFSWAWLATGHLHEVDECIRIVERCFGFQIGDLRLEDAAAALSSDCHEVLVEVAVIQSQLDLHRGRTTEALTLAELAIRLLDSGARISLYTPLEESRCIAHFTLASGHELLGQLAAAEEEFTRALDLARQAGNIHIISAASGHLAKLHSIHGNLLRARQVCEVGIQALQEMIGRSPMSAILLSEWGQIDYEQDNLEIAAERFAEAIDLAKLWGLWEALVPGYCGLASLRRTRGDSDGALQVLDDLALLGRDSPGRVTPAVMSFRALFHARDGKLESALDWVHRSGLDVDREISFQQESVYMILARALIAGNQFDEAYRVLDRLVIAAEAGNRYGRLIGLLALRAVCQMTQGDEEEALKSLSSALELAGSRGYMRTFLDEGAPMAKLLQTALERRIEAEYASKLLTAYEAQAKRREDAVDAPEVSVHPPLLIEPLSDRELEVLRLLSTDLTGPEMAEELSIALSTIRTHTQRIYGKLDVSNRRAAVRRAEELKLL